MEIEPIYLFDKNKELIDIIPYDDLLANPQDWTLNGLIKGTATGIYTESIEQAHFYGTRDIDDPNVFWQYKIVNYTKENGQFTFEGIYVLFDDLAGRGVIRDRRPQNATITTVMEYILEDTGWQLGQVQSTHKGTSNYYYVSKLEAFWDFIEKWRVEFKPRMTFSDGKVTGKYIDIYDRLSGDFGKWYEYGDSLLTVVAEEMRESVFTAFIGRGKGEEVGDGFGRKIGFDDVIWTVEGGNPVDKPIGQDYVEIPWATDLYGYEDGAPRMTVVDFPDIEDESELLDSTYEYALTECRPKVQFKSNVLENGRAEVGEIVTILRPDMDIRYKTRVFNLRRDFLNVAIKTIQFGEQLVQSTAQRTKKTATAIKKQEEQTVYWLEALRKAIVDSYFNEDGYNYDLDANNEYDLPGGYYSFDRPIDQNPTKVVYMGAGKILIANSKNPDGTWNWRTAMTGDGITLDAVNTGVLTAGRILSALSGSYWDLDNDVFHMENGDIQLLDTATGNLVALDHSGVTVSNGTDGIHTKLKNGFVEFGDNTGSPVGGLSTAEILDESERYKGINAFTHAQKFFAISKQWTTGGEYEPVLRTAILSRGLDILVPLSVRETLNMHEKEIQNVKAMRVSANGGVTYNNTSLRPVLTSGNGSELGFGSLSGYNVALRVDANGLITAIQNARFMNYVTMESTLNMSRQEIHNVERLFMGNTSNGLKVSSGRPFLDGTTGVYLAFGEQIRLEVLDTAVRFYKSIDLNGNEILNQSDIRLKSDVKDSDVDALKEIERMKFIEFEWDKTNPANERKPEGRQFGIVAQYSPFLQAKAGDNESYLSIDMTKQVNLNSKAIQELKKENDTLKQEMADLKTLLIDKGLI